MTIKLKTEDIQKMLLCVILNEADVVSEEDKDRYTDILVQLNRMCSKQNGYEIAVTAN